MLVRSENGMVETHPIAGTRRRGKDNEEDNEEDDELKVNISNAEVDKLIKEYKKIKKRRKSNFHQIKLLDQHGRSLDGS